MPSTSRLSDFVADLAPVPSAELLHRIDNWANEVLHIAADTQQPGFDPYASDVILDDLVGSYLARESLQRSSGASDLLVVRGIDELLRAVTAESGRDWPELTGLTDMAGSGWWWSRLPVANVR